MQLDQTVRASAEQAARSLARLADASGLAAALSSGAAVAYPVAGAFSALAAAVSVLAARCSRVQGEMAHDPPRADYQVTTRPYPGRFVSSAFHVQTELDASLLRLSEDLVEASALQSATRRSFERALGARRAASDHWVEIKLAESTDLAEASASVLRQFGVDAQAALERLSEVEGLPGLELSGRLPNVSLDEAITDRDLVVLYRAGIRIEELERRRIRYVASAPRRELGTALSDAADGNAVLAAAFDQWRPVDDVFRE